MIDNEGFKSLNDFGVMDGETDVLEMAKHLAGRSVATRVNLRMAQIKGIQALAWWIHDLQTHNQSLIVVEFGQVFKRGVVT